MALDPALNPKRATALAVADVWNTPPNNADCPRAAAAPSPPRVDPERARVVPPNLPSLVDWKDMMWSAVSPRVDPVLSLPRVALARAREAPPLPNLPSLAVWRDWNVVFLDPKASRKSPMEAVPALPNPKNPTVPAVVAVFRRRSCGGVNE